MGGKCSILRTRSGDGSDRKPGGGCFPIGPTYRPHVARALHALAESRPDPATYARENARILEAHR